MSRDKTREMWWIEVTSQESKRRWQSKVTCDWTYAQRPVYFHTAVRGNYFNVVSVSCR